MEKYTVIITYDERDKIFIATVPMLPGCVTHGNTRAEAATMADDAIECWLAAEKHFNEEWRRKRRAAIK
jgi:predicted RNase H-like HicB family nuclease